MSDSSSRGRLKELNTRFREAAERHRAGRLTLAESLFSELIDAYADGGWLDRRAMAGINLAQVLQQSGKLEEAAGEYERALSVATQIGDQRRVAFCLEGLSTVRKEEGKQEEVEQLIGEALQIFRDLDDSVGIGNQLGNLGVLRQSQGRLEEALACFTEAAQQFAQGGNAAGGAAVLQCIGGLHRAQGEFDEAASAHRRALSLARQHGNRIVEAHSLRALGQLARVKGELEESKERVLAGLSIHRELGDLRGELASLIDLGTVEFARGKGKRAIEHLNSCVSRAEAAGLVVPLCKALLNRALYRLDTEMLDEVEADLAGARALLDKLGDQSAWNVWSVTTARTLIRRAKWDEARAVLDGERERAQRANLGAAHAPIIGLIASIEAARGQVEEARRLFDEAESLYRAIGDYEGARVSLLSRARLLAETGALEQAETAIQTLLVSLEGDSDHPILRAEAISTSAAVHDLEGDYDAALAEVREARVIFEQVEFQISAIGTGLAELKYLVRQSRQQELPLPEWAAGRAAELKEMTETLQAPTIDVIAACVLARLEHGLLMVDGRGRLVEGDKRISETVQGVRVIGSEADSLAIGLGGAFV